MLTTQNFLWHVTSVLMCDCRCWSWLKSGPTSGMRRRIFWRYDLFSTETTNLCWWRKHYLFVCSYIVTLVSACEQEETLALRKEGIGVVLDSELPHLIGIDDDLLSTGIILYHLKVRSYPKTLDLTTQVSSMCLFVFVFRPQEGKTYVGREDASTEQDISEWRQTDGSFHWKDKRASQNQQISFIINSKCAFHVQLT